MDTNRNGHYYERISPYSPEAAMCMLRIWKHFGFEVRHVPLVMTFAEMEKALDSLYEMGYNPSQFVLGWE